jgi:PhzF family phenazine biosynthesis protein
VAVVLKADGLTSEEMQLFANWTNLSETTFVLPAADPKADYHVRIFGPGEEIPFAGHPTIGTAHALLEAGLIRPKDGKLVQECGVGLVNLRVTHGDDGERSISFDLPKPEVAPLSPAAVDELESILGANVLRRFNPCTIDVGPRWVVAQLADAAAVLANRPDFVRMKERFCAPDATGVVVFGEYPQGAHARIEVRAFAPAVGVDEDPVCGSGNGCVGAFIRHTGQNAHFGGDFVSSQGAALDRAGMLRLSVSDECIRVGGAAVTCIDGELLV